MWTAKESAVKLSGRGIGAGISQYVTAKDYCSVFDQKQRCNNRYKTVQYSGGIYDLYMQQYWEFSRPA